jgi:two-component system response regulator YesN
MLYNKVVIIDDDSTVRFMPEGFKGWEDTEASIYREVEDNKERIKKREKFDLFITDIKVSRIDEPQFIIEMQDKKETNVLLEALKVYFSSEREKLMASKLLAYDKNFIEEAKKTFNAVINLLDGNLFKSGIMLKIILERLIDTIYKAYPCLKTIEEINVGNLNNGETTLLDMKSAFLEYADYIMSIVKKYELYQTDSMIKKICGYVLYNVEGNIKNEKIAEFVYIRCDYVGKLFKKKVGYNLSEYINRVKMEHAKYLIKTKRFKSYEVTEKLGYSSPDYFCKLFKNYTGFTPTEFKGYAS